MARLPLPGASALALHAPTPTRGPDGIERPHPNVNHSEMRAVLREAPRGSAVRAVLSAVLLHVGRNGEPCTASIQTLADEAGVNIKTAKRALRDLVPTWLNRVDTPGKVSKFSPATPPYHGVGSKVGRPTLGPALPLAPEGVEPLPTARGVEEEKLFSTAPQHLRKASRRRVPAPPREPAPASARAEPPNAKLFEALILASGWDIKNLTATQRARTGSAAKQLAEIGATPESISVQADVLELSWGQKPAPWTVVAHWGTTIKSRTTAAGRWE